MGLTTDPTFATGLIEGFRESNETIKLRTSEVLRDRVGLESKQADTDDTTLNAVVTNITETSDGDQATVVSDGVVAITKKDKILIDGVVHNIVDLEVVKPAGVVLAYNLKCQKP